MTAVTIRTTGNLILAAPAEVLQNGQVDITVRDIRQLTPDDDQVIFDWIQIVTQRWETFLLLARCNLSTSSLMNWQIVPYSTTNSALWQRLQVGWRTLWGAIPCEDQQTTMSLTSSLLDEPAYRPIYCSDPTILANGLASQHAINTQQVFEGKTVRLLFNYAPQIAPPEGLHWIFIPKVQQGTVSSEMWSEMMSIARKLQLHYEKTYPISWIRYADSATAGRSQQIFNLHLIMGTSSSDETWTKLKVMATELIGPSKLSPATLTNLVASLQQELTPVLTSQGE